MALLLLDNLHSSPRLHSLSWALYLQRPIFSTRALFFAWNFSSTPETTRRPNLWQL